MPFEKGHTKIAGSGIKKGQKQKRTLEKEALREYLIQEVIKEKRPLIKALIAKGKKGDVQALREILDRVLGKAKEQVELGGGETPVEIIIKKGDPTKGNNKKSQVSPGRL